MDAVVKPDGVSVSVTDTVCLLGSMRCPQLQSLCLMDQDFEPIFEYEACKVSLWCADHRWRSPRLSDWVSQYRYRSWDRGIVLKHSER